MVEVNNECVSKRLNKICQGDDDKRIYKYNKDDICEGVECVSGCMSKDGKITSSIKLDISLLN